MESWRLHLEVFRLIVLCGVVVWAAYADLRESRIPNVLTVTALVLGFGLGALVSGFEGLTSAAWGVLAGAGPLMVAYLVGEATGRPVMGAGDVKLMAGIGALAGPWGALWAIYYALWIGGLLALGVATWCVTRRRSLPRALPFGACLAAGTLAAFALRASVFSRLDAFGAT